MDKVARMDMPQATELEAADISPLVTILNLMTHQLPGQGHDSFDRELETTANKEILKGWGETIKHHHVKARFHAKPMDTGNSSPSTKLRVDTMLVI